MAAMLSFAVGANDCANSFGTAVGSGTLTLKQACYLAAFFETFGAIFFSAAVGATIRKGVFDASKFSSFSADFATKSPLSYEPLCADEIENEVLAETEFSNLSSYHSSLDDRGKISFYLSTTYCPLVADKNGGSCTYPYSIADGQGSTEFWEENLENTVKDQFFNNSKSTFTCKNLKIDYAINDSFVEKNPLLDLEGNNTIIENTTVIRPELTLAYIHLCAMTASAVWQLFATRFSLPVSGTHSIIGALIGGGIAGKGMEAIAWSKVGAVALSWVTSPTLSCLIAYAAYHYVGTKVIRGNDPIKAIQQLFPVLLGFVGFLNFYTCLMIQYKNNKDWNYVDVPISKKYIQETIGLKKSWWAVNPAILAVPAAVLLFLIVKVFVMPLVIKAIDNPKVKEAIRQKFLKERDEILEKEAENGVSNQKRLPFDGPIKEESIESSNASIGFG